MILLNKKVYFGLCGINIFFNIVLFANLFFPSLILPIDYDNLNNSNILMSVDSLNIHKDFYFFSKYYDEFYGLINAILFYLYILYTAASIIGSTRAPKAYFFITLAILLSVIFQVISPLAIYRWETNFMYSTSVILNGIIWGIQSALRAEKNQF